MMGELAMRYPAGTLLVSTGSQGGSEAVDADLPNRVDRIADSELPSPHDPGALRLVPSRADAGAGLPAEVRLVRQFQACRVSRALAASPGGDSLWNLPLWVRAAAPAGTDGQVPAQEHRGQGDPPPRLRARDDQHVDPSALPGGPRRAGMGSRALRREDRFRSGPIPAASNRGSIPRTSAPGTVWGRVVGSSPSPGSPPTRVSTPESRCWRT